jgi:hypothetical protein
MHDKRKKLGSKNPTQTVSLNEAGTLLACSVCGMNHVEVLRVRCDTKEKIDSVKYVTELHLVFSLGINKSNILVL